MNRYRVYVIELRPRNGSRGLGDVYVGSSGLAPEDRLAHHRTSPKGSRHVRRRGVRLRRDLYRGMPTFYDRDEAKRAEKWLAAELRKKGYRVYGSCSQKQSPECVL